MPCKLIAMARMDSVRLQEGFTDIHRRTAYHEINDNPALALLFHKSPMLRDTYRQSVVN